MAASDEPQFPSSSAAKTPSTTSARDKHDYHESVKQTVRMTVERSKMEGRNERLATRGRASTDVQSALGSPASIVEIKNVTG
jgi:hypothetical protein